MYQERELEIGGLLSSLLIWTVLYPPSNARELVSTILESQVWNEQKWTLVFAEWLVWNYMASIGMEEDEESTDLKLYQQVLATLHQMDPNACEKGMAQAMIEEEEEDGFDKKRLALLLEGVLPAGSKSSAVVSESANRSSSTPSI